jgi:hypothetical protein
MVFIQRRTAAETFGGTGDFAGVTGHARQAVSRSARSLSLLDGIDICKGDEHRSSQIL